MIRYNPKEKDRSDPQPQQSSHLAISYVEIGHATGNEKYWNVFEDATACRFPALGQKLYGEVLVWGEEKTADLIRKTVVDECKKQQERLKKLTR